MISPSTLRTKSGALLEMTVVGRHAARIDRIRNFHLVQMRERLIHGARFICTISSPFFP